MAHTGSRIRLTKRLLDATAAPATGAVILRDSEVPGFAVRFTSGATSFVVEKRIQGRLWKISLGPFGPMTVEEGRAKARDTIAQLVRGEDPTQARGELTFGQLAEQYLQRHAIPLKRSVSDDVGMIKNHLASWRGRRLSTLSTNDVAMVHSRVGQRAPYAANRVLALIRVMFHLAKVWKLFAGENPAVGIKPFPETSRDRFVQPSELGRFFTALQQEPNIFVRSAFFVALLTGARKTETLSMRWADVNLQEAVWRLPVTKSNRAHMLPLPLPVLDVLRTLPRLPDSPFVFPGRKSGTCLANVSKNWRRIIMRAGLHDVRIHDLRRTTGSWLAASGASLLLIGKTLNHSQVSTTAIYARLNLDPVREALEANAQKMLTHFNVPGAQDGEEPLRG